MSRATIAFAAIVALLISGAPISQAVNRASDESGDALSIGVTLGGIELVD